MSTSELRERLRKAQQLQVLEWHLSYNCYPSQIGALEHAQAAITAVNEGDPDRVIGYLPSNTPVTASMLVEDLRLDEFLDPDILEF